MVVEDGLTGWCGAVTRWENGMVVLEDRHGKIRSFPLGKGFLLDGRLVELVTPVSSSTPVQRTASGSRIGPRRGAKIALPSRIFVEGTHDAELVEKIWGDDLRHVGVVVEPMHGVDDLVAIIDDFDPEPGRRLGVLVDHLIPGTKEMRIVDQVRQGSYADVVMITGHEFVDIWAAVKPERVGLQAWPQIPRTMEWKHGICAALGLAHAEQADIAHAWKAILARVGSYKDLDKRMVTEVEKLIDFVTQDHLRDIE